MCKLLYFLLHVCYFILHVILRGLSVYSHFRTIFVYSNLQSLLTVCFERFIAIFSSRNACCIFQSGDCILRRFFNITANFVVVYFCLLVSCIGKWKRVRCFNIGLVIYPRQRLYAPDSPGPLKANDRAMFECCRDSLPNGSYSSYSPTATFAPTGTC